MIGNKIPDNQETKIYGLLRVRNEESIISDTLKHLASFCTGGIFVYDDCSEDKTAEICKNFPSVIKVIENDKWDLNRERAEFENRAAILKEAQKIASLNDWLVYIDADERVEFDWSKIYSLPEDVIAVRMKLFDYYITPEDVDKPYYERTKIGPEYRKIIIAFRNLPTLEYKFMDQREVWLGTEGKILEDGYVKHYGKAISVEEWEKTCDYYSKYFPKYSEKWEKRRGKAVHDGVSDFGNPLISWEEKESKGIDLMEIERQLSQKENNSKPKLKILLTTHHLLGFTGSELYTYTLAKYLKRNKQDVYVYSRYIGSIKKLFEDLGISIVEHLEALKEIKFDVALVNHNLNSIEVRKIFPNVPIIMLVHGIIPFLEKPAPFEINVSFYLALSKEIKKKLLEAGIDEEKIVLFPNIVDPEIFREEKPVNAKPENILVISNKLDLETQDVIINASTSLNLNLKFIGKNYQTASIFEMPGYINWADIVITLGRGAIESMMCGRIPLILDYDGGDGLVTPENFDELAEFNFSGRKHRIKFTGESLAEEISKYNPENSKILKKEVLKRYSAGSAVNHLMKLIDGAVENFSPQNISGKEIQIIDFIYNLIHETRYYMNLIDKINYRNLAEKDFLKTKLDLSEELIEKNKLEDAQNILDDILVVHPGNTEALNNLAVIHILKNQYGIAERILKRVLEIDPSNEIAEGNLMYLTNQIDI